MFRILKTNTDVLDSSVVWKRTKLNTKKPFDLVKLVRALSFTVILGHT